MFSIPIQQIAVDETIAAGFLELLGLRTKISYIDTRYLYSDCLINMVNQNRIQRFESVYGNLTVRAKQIDSVDAYFTAPENTTDTANIKAITYSASVDPLLLRRALFNRDLIPIFCLSEWLYRP